MQEVLNLVPSRAALKAGMVRNSQKIRTRCKVEILTRSEASRPLVLTLTNDIDSTFLSLKGQSTNIMFNLLKRTSLLNLIGGVSASLLLLNQPAKASPSNTS
jgi:hypothetical protein